jgi:hypothetical protein
MSVSAYTLENTCDVGSCSTLNETKASLCPIPGSFDYKAHIVDSLADYPTSNVDCSNYNLIDFDHLIGINIANNTCISSVVNKNKFDHLCDISVSAYTLENTQDVDPCMSLKKTGACLDLVSGDCNYKSHNVDNLVDYALCNVDCNNYNLIEFESCIPSPLSCNHGQLDVSVNNVFDGDKLVAFDSFVNRFDLDFNVSDIICELKFKHLHSVVESCSVCLFNFIKCSSISSLIWLFKSRFFNYLF